MNSLWETVSALLRDISGSIDPRTICAVGISGHGNGIYPLNKQGQPFMNAVLSMDMRAQEIVDEWNRDGRGAEISRYTAQHLWAGQPLPLLEWFKRYEPDIYENIGTAFFCKDYINYMLCGNLTTDYSDISGAGGFDNVKRSVSPELYKICGLKNLFPRVIKSSGIAGRITPEAATQTGLCEGVIVCGGSMDVAACSFGAGAYQDYSITAGTWSINAAYTDQCITDKSILQCQVSGGGDRWFAVESSPTSAVNLDWFIKNVSPLSYKECDQIAGRYGAADCEGIYLPYVYPMPRFPNVKAGFFGTSESNEEKLRVLYEGIAFGHKFHVENLQKAGIKRDKVRLSGGLTSSDVWCQILADVLGMPIETAKVNNEGALGAAFYAGTAALLFSSPEESSLQICADKIYLPKSSYEQKYSFFKERIYETYRNR
jgi:L-xylulokinase